MSPLNNTDRAIIAALRLNARMSLSELAQTINVSRTTAKSRLERLIETGRIRKFTIETDVQTDGAIEAVTLVELQGKMSNTVVRSLERIPEISSIFSTNGVWDLVLNIKTDTLPNFDRVLREVREVDGVLNSETCMLLSRIR